MFVLAAVALDLLPAVEIVAVSAAGHSPGHCWKMGFDDLANHAVLHPVIGDLQMIQQP